jgi:hypothetical protein
MALLTVTALVAGDSGVVSGLGAVTSKVTEFSAVVAGHVGGRTRFRTLARHVAFTIAVLANDNSLIGAVGLVVAVEVVSERQTHLRSGMLTQLDRN